MISEITEISRYIGFDDELYLTCYNQRRIQGGRELWRQVVVPESKLDFFPNDVAILIFKDNFYIFEMIETINFIEQ